MAACTVGPGADDLGTFSPAAIKAVGTTDPGVSAAPYVAGTGGFSCTNSSLLTLSGINHLYATIPAATTLKLTSTTTTDQVTYQVAAAADGTTPLPVGTQVTLVSGSLSLIGLGSGSGPMAVSIYIKPATARTGALIAPGTYTGTFKINWDWYFCSGLYTTLTGCTLGVADGGTGQSTVSVTLQVTAKPLTMTVSSATTWDPISAVVNPKALPGSKRRTTLTITNPDIVSPAVGTIKMILPTAALTVVALDGDGTGLGAAVQTPLTTSGLAVIYISPGATDDDVDFSNSAAFATDETSWTAAPIDAASQALVKAVRFRPRGTMAAGSSFSVSIPYAVK